MQHTTLTINGTAYRLAPGDDVPALKRSIEDAAQAGGRLVDFMVAGTEVSVLVTALSSILFEKRDAPEDPLDDPGPDNAFDPDDLDR